MLKETYRKYKLIYNDYIIIIKNGNFYDCLNEDAIIINSLFKYKIIKTKNLLKIGFPIDSINKIMETLDIKNINYIVLNEEIIKKQKFNDNNYIRYQNKKDNYDILLSRITKIDEILKDNLTDKNIKNILNVIEDELCKIDC